MAEREGEEEEEEAAEREGGGGGGGGWGWGGGEGMSLSFFCSSISLTHSLITASHVFLSGSEWASTRKMRPGTEMEMAKTLAAEGLAVMLSSSGITPFMVVFFWSV